MQPATALQALPNHPLEKQPPPPFFPPGVVFACHKDPALAAFWSKTRFLPRLRRNRENVPRFRRCLHGRSLSVSEKTAPAEKPAGADCAFFYYRASPVFLFFSSAAPHPLTTSSAAHAASGAPSPVLGSAVAPSTRSVNTGLVALPCSFVTTQMYL